MKKSQKAREIVRLGRGGKLPTDLMDAWHERTGIHPIDDVVRYGEAETASEVFFFVSTCLIAVAFVASLLLSAFQHATSFKNALIVAGALSVFARILWFTPTVRSARAGRPADRLAVLYDDFTILDDLFRLGSIAKLREWSPSKKRQGADQVLVGLAQDFVIAQQHGYDGFDGSSEAEEARTRAQEADQRFISTRGLFAAYALADKTRESYIDRAKAGLLKAK